MLAIRSDWTPPKVQWLDVFFATKAFWIQAESFGYDTVRTRLEGLPSQILGHRT